mmetsp:Transcript_5369/g.11800  ORF Transcript_5369/g.11800 Transcript_5369/m.11800 type:complete len:264 (+) Transcript_5369:59-850(+)
MVVMTREDGKDESLLKELREISDKHSSYKNRSNEPIETHRVVVSSSASSDRNISENNMVPRDNVDKSEADKFLCETAENSDLNQYWYSKNTIETICDAIRECFSISEGTRVAFISTPSLFFSLSLKEREQSALFDFDTSWESCSGYHFYDYKDPANVKEECLGVFDLVVIDPPFITQSVWENYAITAKLLAKGDTSEQRIIATTVNENDILMKDLFGCKPAAFQPSIPHLVYQYSVFTNFPSSALAEMNSELTEKEATRKCDK